MLRSQRLDKRFSDELARISRTSLQVVNSHRYDEGSKQVHSLTVSILCPFTQRDFLSASGPSSYQSTGDFNSWLCSQFQAQEKRAALSSRYDNEWNYIGTNTRYSWNTAPGYDTRYTVVVWAEHHDTAPVGDLLPLNMERTFLLGSHDATSLYVQVRFGHLYTCFSHS